MADDSVTLGKIEKQKVVLKEPVKKIKGSLLIKDKQVIKDLIEYQLKKDSEDIEILWKNYWISTTSCAFSKRTALIGESFSMIPKAATASKISPSMRTFPDGRRIVAAVPVFPTFSAMCMSCDT